MRYWQMFRHLDQWSKREGSEIDSHKCWLLTELHKKFSESRTVFSKSSVAAAAAKLLQSCPTLCDPIEGSPPGSAIPGILQARTVEWVAISFSNAWKWKVKVKLLSRVWLFTTPWTAAYQAPLSMGFSRQEYWRGLPLPSPKVVLEQLVIRVWKMNLDGNLKL